MVVSAVADDDVPELSIASDGDVTEGANASFTISTTADATDEPDGSGAPTLASGSGYTVSSIEGSATAAVADDDDPLVIPDPGQEAQDEEQDEDEGASTDCTLPADAVTVAEVTGWRDALPGC